MPTNRANVFDDEATRTIKQIVKQVLASHQPRPEGGRKRRGGGETPGDGGNSLWMGYTNEVIPAGTGDYDEREPGTGDGTVLLGEGDSTNWENYSLVEIDENAICILAEIDGHNVIIQALC